MDISDLISDITSQDGWICGSYVRDVMIRRDPSYELKDLDVLIPFDMHKFLVEFLENKYGMVSEELDYNEDDEIAHTHLEYKDIIVDIFSSEMYEYLSPLDYDVNSICWNGKEYVSWYPGNYNISDEEYYGYSFDIDDIIERIHKKQAIVMLNEVHEFDDDMLQRYEKLINKGWTILNMEQLEDWIDNI